MLVSGRVIVNCWFGLVGGLDSWNPLMKGCEKSPFDMPLYLVKLVRDLTRTDRFPTNGGFRIREMGPRKFQGNLLTVEVQDT